MFRSFTVVAIVLAAASCVSPPNRAPQQEAPKPEAPHASLLDELIEKSKRVDAYTATFTMTAADDPAPVTIRCDYRAPAAVKVVVTKPGGTTSSSAPRTSTTPRSLAWTCGTSMLPSPP